MDGQSEFDEARLERLRVAVQSERIQKNMLLSIESALKQIVSYFPKESPLDYSEPKWEKFQYLMSRLDTIASKAANMGTKYSEPPQSIRPAVVSQKTGRPRKKDTATPDEHVEAEPSKPTRPSFGTGDVGV